MFDLNAGFVFDFDIGDGDGGDLWCLSFDLGIE